MTTITTTHTPGSWHVGTAAPSIIYALDGFAIANAVTYHGRHGGIETMQANARLIAAAPELLDVLKRFISACDHYLPPATHQAFCGLFAAAAEVIARVEGTEP